MHAALGPTGPQPTYLLLASSCGLGFLEAWKLGSQGEHVQRGKKAEEEAGEAYDLHSEAKQRG